MIHVCLAWRGWLYEIFVTLFVVSILSLYTMNFARFSSTTYHSFQSVYQVGRTKGFESFFRVLSRCIRREITPKHMARRTQEHVQINIEPRLRLQKPVKGNNEPLKSMNEPLCGIVQPVRGINEALRGKKSPVQQRVLAHCTFDWPSICESCGNLCIDYASIRAVNKCDWSDSEYNARCACRPNVRKCTTQSKVKRCRDREPSRIPFKLCFLWKVTAQTYWGCTQRFELHNHIYLYFIWKKILSIR